MNRFTGFKNWCRRNLVRQNVTRSTVFWGCFIIFLFNCMVIFVTLPVLLSTVDSYPKIEGTGESAEQITHTEMRRGRERRNHLLTFTLQEADTKFELTDDYTNYWTAISTSVKAHEHIMVYIRPGSTHNPMQIEANGKVLLPLSYHKKMSWIATIILEAVCILAFFVVRRNYRIYKIHLREKDRIKWQTGFKGKMKVAGRWLTK